MSSKFRTAFPDSNLKIAFSGLDSSVAGKIEEDFANAGYTVVSNSKNHRMDKFVPLLVPEINPGHLELIKKQDYKNNGCIVTNPNCSTIGLVLALKPLVDKFGIEEVNVVTMQAISGAGYPGLQVLILSITSFPSSGEAKKKKLKQNLTRSSEVSAAQE